MQDMSVLVRELTTWATRPDLRPSAKTALQLEKIGALVAAELTRLGKIEDAARAVTAARNGRTAVYSIEEPAPFPLLTALDALDAVIGEAP